MLFFFEHMLFKFNVFPWYMIYIPLANTITYFVLLSLTVSLTFPTALKCLSPIVLSYKHYILRE